MNPRGRRQGGACPPPLLRHFVATPAHGLEPGRRPADGQHLTPFNATLPDSQAIAGQRAEWLLDNRVRMYLVSLGWKDVAQRAKGVVCPQCFFVYTFCKSGIGDAS